MSHVTLIEIQFLGSNILWTGELPSPLPRPRYLASSFDRHPFQAAETGGEPTDQLLPGKPGTHFSSMSQDVQGAAGI